MSEEVKGRDVIPDRGKIKTITLEYRMPVMVTVDLEGGTVRRVNPIYEELEPVGADWATTEDDLEISARSQHFDPGEYGLSRTGFDDLVFLAETIAETDTWASW